eukprot:11964864-Alexandrium_andersonii.AAC.1
MATHVRFLADWFENHLRSTPFAQHCSVDDVLAEQSLGVQVQRVLIAMQRYLLTATLQGRVARSCIMAITTAFADLDMWLFDVQTGWRRHSYLVE